MSHVADAPAPGTGAGASPFPVRDAALRRRSRSHVTDDAPTRAELLDLVQAAGTVADHSGLKPWRLIELRGDDRARAGRGMAKAGGAKGDDVDRGARRFERAPLVLAVVVSPRQSSKVPDWEQEAVASGVAHLLSLLLDEAGWGVFWRTGRDTRHRKVAKSHRLEKGEKLLGWLYVGGANEKDRKVRKPIDASTFLRPL